MTHKQTFWHIDLCEITERGGGGTDTDRPGNTLITEINKENILPEMWSGVLKTVTNVCQYPLYILA